MYFYFEKKGISLLSKCSWVRLERYLWIVVAISCFGYDLFSLAWRYSCF